MSDTGVLSGAVPTINNHGVHSQPANFSSRGRLLLALVFVLSALYMARELKRGLVPWDEGVLAESAERVLHGELPHRDYHEIYTGGLSYLNAAAFRAFLDQLADVQRASAIIPWLGVKSAGALQVDDDDGSGGAL